MPPKKTASKKKSAKNTIGVGLIGFGNIGTGVVRYLSENSELINARLPQPIELLRICDVDLKTKRDAPYTKNMLTKDYRRIVSNPKIHIVIELIGGTTIAKTVVEAALCAGKGVVTANKALLAEHGAELYALAKKHKTPLLYESSVLAGVPLMRSLLQSLSGNRFQRIQGIVNGTCNYILTKMEEEGSDFDKTLKVAQDLGYAEADAELDVGGIDAAHKCAVLASLAFGQDIRFADVYREGIRSIDPLDFEIANDYGMKIKLVATAEKLNWGAVLARVHPVMMPRSSMLSGVSGVYNAAVVEGVPMGQYFFHGEGAGPGSTASGVIGDVVAIAAAIANGGRANFQLLPVPAGKKDVAPMAAWEGRYYMRVKSSDIKGSLSSLVFGLEQNAIPIREVSETEVIQGRRKTTWLILMTKMTTEAALQSALQKLQESGILKKSPTVIRIEDKL